MNRQDISILVIALLISCSGIIINLIRKGKAEKVILTKDGATLFWFRVLVPLALIISMVIYYFGIAHRSASAIVIYTSYFLVALGLLIRWIALIRLGNAFTVKVSILKDHVLKTDGIYRYIRHPSYTGLLFYYLGLGLLMQHWTCIVLLTVLPLLAVIIRINIEEQVLIENFASAYKSYQERSWRLLPFVY